MLLIYIFIHVLLSYTLLSRICSAQQEILHSRNFYLNLAHLVFLVAVFVFTLEYQKMFLCTLHMFLSKGHCILVNGLTFWLLCFGFGGANLNRRDFITGSFAFLWDIVWCMHR